MMLDVIFEIKWHHKIINFYFIYLEAELDVYKSVITLFILCGAANILSNCSLESAISYMTATREKHEEKIGGLY